MHRKLERQPDPEAKLVLCCAATLFAIFGFLALTEEPIPQVEPPFCYCEGDTDCAHKCGDNGDPTPVEVLP